MTPRPPGGATRVVGERLAVRRVKLGRSQRDVAGALGWEGSMLGRIESGRVNITVEQLVRLADELDAAPSSFLTNVRPGG